VNRGRKTSAWSQNVHKTYITDHFIQRSEWTPSTSAHARL